MPTAPGWPEGVGRVILDSIDSTNAEALRRAPGLSRPEWILARRQEAGRGRRGRGWESRAGNFYASLALPDGGVPAEAARLSFVAALALHEVLAGLVGPLADVAIKWPNDVLLNGGKVAGILLESAGAGADLQAVAVGIGVNLAEAPDPGRIEARAIAPVSVRGESGHSVSPEEFLDLLAPAFARWQAQLDTYGFAPIRSAWLARAAKLGEPIVARTGTAESHGIFEGIDEQGALILRGAAGRQILPAADVFFGG